MSPVRSTTDDAKFQIRTALNFVDLARRPEEKVKDRKEFLLMAFMHAQSGAVIGDCAGFQSFEYYDLKSCIHHALKVLLRGKSMDDAIATYDEWYTRLRLKF
jgi:hypothetical protein